MNDFIIRSVSKYDLEACVHVESSCFAPSEAASKESIEQRIEIYPDGFLVAVQNENVVGMINSGATHKDDITDEEFKKMIGHDRDGQNIVVFSLAVSPDYQGLGVSRKLMDQFIETARAWRRKKFCFYARITTLPIMKNWVLPMAAHPSRAMAGLIGMRWCLIYRLSEGVTDGPK
jgi:ribosomal protein S18 acetylase RimI-like enzyme